MQTSDHMVYIIDDDPAMRDSLQTLLRSVGISSEAYSSGEDFLKHAEIVKSACVLLDVRMPGKSGIELHRNMIEGGMQVPVIFITGHGDISIAVQAMKAGGFDFIEKPFNEQDLLERIHACLFEADHTIQQQNRRMEARERLRNLTKRERDVLYAMAEGMTSKEIAKELDISPKTVDVHRAHIMEKTRARSITDLLRCVVLAEQD